MSLSDPQMAVAAAGEWDVRDVPKARRDQMIFDRFDALAEGDSFVFVICHDPRHLHEQFARKRPGLYGWRYLEGSQSEQLWRIRIIRTPDPSPALNSAVSDRKHSDGNR